MKNTSVSLYERVEEHVASDVTCAKITYKDGSTETVYAFDYQPVKFIYDDEGFETVEKEGEPYKCIRYTPKCVGEATIVYCSDNENAKTINVLPSESNGFIRVSNTDRRYFEYSDGTAYVPIGINMAFPTTYEKHNGNEFGTSGEFCYVGMKQYERWFRKASQNGVNMVRVWIGHPYFTPDKDNAYDLDLVQLSKIDELVNLAKKYGLTLKLTLENFRYFDYDRIADTNSYSDDVFRKFNKKIYMDGQRCESTEEWITTPKYLDGWLYKVNELAKRFGDDTSIFAIELWNEMNSIHCPMEKTLEWNKQVLPKVAEMFPDNMVVNSLGSFESEGVKKTYENFCWDKSSFKQVHRYLDQGASYEVCHENPLALLKDACEVLATDDMPFIAAETGAVNNCHSGPFKFYINDDDGILFADCVYTPFFAGSAGCGHIWHWDERYVEAKTLYKMYKPFTELIDGIDVVNEGFRPSDLSTDDAYVLTLNGKSYILGYIRNKTANWRNMLRDLRDAEIISELKVNIKGAKSVELINIWDDDITVEKSDCDVTFKNINYGVMFKVALNGGVTV